MSALDDLVNRSNWQIGTVIIIGGDNRYSAEYIGDDPSLSEAADELAELRNELSDEEESRKFAQACLEQEEQKNIALRERVEALERLLRKASGYVGYFAEAFDADDEDIEFHKNILKELENDTTIDPMG